MKGKQTEMNMVTAVKLEPVQKHEKEIEEKKKKTLQVEERVQVENKKTWRCSKVSLV